MQVDFYHLTLHPIERVLPRIAERVVAGGGCLLIVAQEASQRETIDRLLWAYAPESFLPHGCAGGPNDAVQPILIAPDAHAPNAARNIAIIDGTWREEALGFDRAFHLFDAERIAEARVAWKALADREGVERRYWKQNDGGGWAQAG